ncbi:MAG TPA: hypothetical protein VI756_32695, partial [Blastocatellia bacterium]
LDAAEHLAGVAMFFQAGDFVRMIGAGGLSKAKDPDIKVLARCLGLNPDWSTGDGPPCDDGCTKAKEDLQ